MTMGGGRLAVMAIQVAGILLAAFLVAVTYLDPQQVEQRYQQLAFTKVERAAEANWSDIEVGDDGLVGKIKAFSGSLADKAALIEDKRQETVQAILANALSGRCGDDCGPWVAHARNTDSLLIRKVAGLRLRGTTLQQFIVGRYDRAVDGLTADLRRFGLVNLVVLSLALAAMMLRRGFTGTRLAVFSMAVTAYTGWATYDYIFRQDWERTVLLRDWAASGYQISMIVVACLLADWVLLKGRITDAVFGIIDTIYPG